MNEDIAWGYVSKIPIGDIVSWIIFLGIILGAFSVAVVKMYKLFEKVKNTQDENTALKQMVQNHETMMLTISKELQSIRNEQEASKKRELKRLRHTIIKAGEEAVASQHITIRKLKSLEELFEEYSGFTDEDGKPANGYVKSLMHKVRNVEVIGSLNDNNEDID